MRRLQKRLAALWRNPRIAGVVIGLVGVALTTIVWQALRSSEDRSLQYELATRAANQSVFLQERVDDYLEKLQALKALFESGEHVTRDRFEVYSNVLFEHHKGISNIAWAPRVLAAERAAHERAGQGEGLANYHIVDDTFDGRLAVAPERPVYFPKFYSTQPLQSPSYGIDLLSSFPAVVERMVAGDTASVTPPLVLHIATGNPYGFWVGMPAYKPGLPHRTVTEREQNVLGIVQVVFQSKPFFDSIFASIRSSFELSIFNPAAGPKGSLVYTNAPETGLAGASPGEGRNGGKSYAFPLKIGDAVWQAVLVPQPTLGPSDNRHRASSIAFICGLLLSAVLAANTRKSRDYLISLKEANRRLEHKHVEFETALNNMVQGLLMFDSSGRLIVYNRRFLELAVVSEHEWSRRGLGLTAPEVIQLTEDLTGLSLVNRAQVISELTAIRESGHTGQIVIERGDQRTFVAACAPMSDGGYVITLADITESRRSEERIAHLAHYDTLTELPNRLLFYQTLETALTGRDCRTIAVLSLDLDRFKGVNDTLGHPVGDKVLQEAARRMRNTIRENEMVARLGGDEFAIVMKLCHQPSDATILARRVIDAVSAAYEIDGHRLMIGLSVGIALAPGDGNAADQLMKSADLALYRCKADGGNTYRFFERQMDARMQRRRTLELDLRQALMNEEFFLEYQPLINLKTGKVSACEALIRWRHPDRGLVAPAEFIPIAEETNQIVPIGEWVLKRACVDAAEWPADIAVAVNVSPAQFKSSEFVNSVRTALRQSGLPARRLELEITELVLIHEPKIAQALLTKLHEIGISIAMDDFGTGYSSLGYLRSFPFDKIKIDRSFVSDLGLNKDSLAILRAVVALGRSLEMVTTAEGVETKEQLDLLTSEGCTEAQGYFFSTPKPAAEINALLQSMCAETLAVA